MWAFFPQVLLGPACTDCTQVSFWCQQILLAVQNKPSWLPSAGVLRIGSSGVKSNMASLASVIAARYCHLVSHHISTYHHDQGLLCLCTSHTIGPNSWYCCPFFDCPLTCCPFTCCPLTCCPFTCYPFTCCPLFCCPLTCCPSVCSL